MKVIVSGKSVIDTGEKVHCLGDELDLPDKEARKLMAKGLVKKAPAAKKDKEPADGGKKDQKKDNPPAGGSEEAMKGDESLEGGGEADLSKDKDQEGGGKE